MSDEKGRHSSEISADENCRDTPVAHKSKRIEDLLLDDNPQPVSFRQLAEQEIRSMDQGGRSLRRMMLIAAVVISVAVIGWFFAPFFLTTPPPDAAGVAVEKRQVMPERPEPQTAGATGDVPATSAEILLETAVNDASAPAEKAPVPPVVDESVYRVLVGPFIRQSELDTALMALQEQGFQPQQLPGSGAVTMIRLLEGLYPEPEAEHRLQQLLLDVSSAFKLRDGERWALYAGSFYDRERAARLQKILADKHILVNQIEVELSMEGTLLDVLHADRETVEHAAEQISAAGLKARIESYR